MIGITVGSVVGFLVLNSHNSTGPNTHPVYGADELIHAAVGSGSNEPVHSSHSVSHVVPTHSPFPNQTHKPPAPVLHSLSVPHNRHFERQSNLIRHKSVSTK